MEVLEIVQALMVISIEVILHPLQFEDLLTELEQSDFGSYNQLKLFANWIQFKELLHDGEDLAIFLPIHCDSLLIQNQIDHIQLVLA